jgi:hypothetical protein
LLATYRENGFSGAIRTAKEIEILDVEPIFKETKLHKRRKLFESGCKKNHDFF